ncbi:baseplate J/gp47 family protein [Thiotrichales bacterium 19S3-7]|nr:baseplate J/gp47 family protein [Thiotrichales bacterium 19S3-7]MCF6801278.1 baseplate J/gp47 family protein [Thiotrichales bacterium 19S3-11]
MKRNDLSKLPLPEVIQNVDYEKNYQLLLNDFKVRLPEYNADIDSDPAVKLLQSCAYGLTIYQMRINDAVKSVLITSAEGSNLDNLGALLAIFREKDEVDERYRLRILTALEKASSAGSRYAYEALAMESDSRVIDVIAYDDPTQPGVAFVLIQSCEYLCGRASTELISGVKHYLSAPERKPLGCQVVVMSIKPVEYSIDAKIILDEDSDEALVLKTIKNTIKSFTKARHRIGQCIPLSEIYARLNIEGVSFVDQLIQPTASIITSNKEAPYCKEIKIEVSR